MTVEEQLRELILKRYKSVRAFALENQIPYSTVDNIFKRGLRNIGITTAIKICSSLEIDIDALAEGRIRKRDEKIQGLISPAEQEHIQKYRDLDYHGKEMVDIVLEKETERMNKEQGETAPVIDLMRFLAPASAGTGIPLDGTQEWETIEVDSNAYTRKADFCITVKGNSMEPKFYNGDILLVKEQIDVDFGEIGIFVLNGQGYVKQKGEDRLISLNAEIPDVYIKPGDAILCTGLVVGTLDPDWIRCPKL